MGQSCTGRGCSLSTAVVICRFLSTTTAHALPFTFCSYRNYKQAKPGRRLRDSSSALSEMEEQWIEKHSHFYGVMMVGCPENHSVNIMYSFVNLLVP